MITVEEVLRSKGVTIGPMLKDSVREADYRLEFGEKATAAWQAAFSVDGSYHAGVVAITTHRLLCCSCVANNLIVATLPFSECIGIGEESGRLQKQMPIHCDGANVIIKASGAHIVQIRAKLLSAIEAAPLQKPIELSPDIFRRSSAEHRQIQARKATHSGERRLTKTEATAYGKCPSCKGTVLIEKKGKVSCMKCGHEFSSGK